MIGYDEWKRGEPGADPETDKPVIGTDLVAAIGAIRAYGPAEHPEVYTGLRSGTAARPGVLTIYLTELDPAVQDEFIAASGLRRSQVQFEQSHLTQRDSVGAIDRVKSDIEAGLLDDVDLADVRVRAARDGLVELRLAGHDPSQIATLADRYGASIRIITDAPAAG